MFEATSRDVERAKMSMERGGGGGYGRGGGESCRAKSYCELKFCDQYSHTVLQGMTAMEEIAAMEEDTEAAMEAAAELMGAEAAMEDTMTGLVLIKQIVA